MLREKILSYLAKYYSVGELRLQYDLTGRWLPYVEQGLRQELIELKKEGKIRWENGAITLVEG